MKKTVHVIGAGFSGLSLAYRLAKYNFDVHVYDQRDQVGGLIRTLKTKNGIAEAAANSIMITQSTLDFLNEIEAPLVYSQKSAARRFLFKGKPRRWPLNFYETMCLIGSILKHLLTGKKYLKPLPLENLAQWGIRNFGKVFTFQILGPAMQGIYAGDLSKLSASLIIGPMFKKNKERYLGLVSGPEGMQDIVSSLDKKCRQLGVKFHLGQSVQLQILNRTDDDIVILATSAAEAANLTKTLYPELSSKLSQIPMNSLVSATAFFDKAETNYIGFGCLIPRKLGVRSLGVLLNSYIFPGRSKVYNETYIMGGAEDLALAECPDTEISNILLNERKKIFNYTNAPIELVVTKWKQALPHYTVQLEQIIPKLELPKGIYLHGNYLGGIGLSKIIDASSVLAKKLFDESKKN